MNLSGLLDEERSSLVTLFGQVRARLDRPYDNSRNTSTRRMVPGSIQQAIQQDAALKSPTDSRTVTWACVPYFSLDRYVNDDSFGDGSHPKRTLSQLRFAFSERARDMLQAVASLTDAEPSFCYHVSQVWYVVIADCEYKVVIF